MLSPLTLLSMSSSSITLVLLATPTLATPTPKGFSLFSRYNNTVHGLALTIPKMLTLTCSSPLTRSGEEVIWGCEIPSHNLTIGPIINEGPYDIDVQKIYDQDSPIMTPYTMNTSLIELEGSNCPILDKVYTCGAFYRVKVVRIQGWITVPSLKDLLPPFPKEPEEEFYEVDFPRLDTDREEDTFMKADAEMEACICPNFPGGELDDGDLETCPDWCW